MLGAEPVSASTLQNQKHYSDNKENAGSKKTFFQLGKSNRTKIKGLKIPNLNPSRVPLQNAIQNNTPFHLPHSQKTLASGQFPSNNLWTMSPAKITRVPCQKSYKEFNENSLQFQLLSKVSRSSTLTNILSQSCNEKQTLLEAVIKIQSWWRMVKARKEFISLRSSALKVQRWYRQNTQPSNHFSFLQEAAAIRIQSIFRMYNCKKRYIQTLIAVLTIQTWYRKVLFQRYLQKANSSATIIQRGFRKYLSHKEFKEKNHSATKIQSWFRMLRERSKYQETRHAVVKIQRWFRDIKKQKEEHRQYTAATKIQALFKMIKCRKKYLEIKSSVLKIQSWFRMLKQKQEFACLKKKVVVLQSFARAYYHRKRYQKLKAAVKVIETNYAKKKLQKQKLIQVVKIQKWYRLFQVRSLLYQKIQYGIVLHRYMRKWIHKKKLLQQKLAVKTIENWYLGILQKRQESKKLESVVNIQAFFRMVIEKQNFRKIFNSNQVIPSPYNNRTDKQEDLESSQRTPLEQNDNNKIEFAKLDLVDSTKIDNTGNLHSLHSCNIEDIPCPTTPTSNTTLKTPLSFLTPSPKKVQESLVSSGFSNTIRMRQKMMNKHRQPPITTKNGNSKLKLLTEAQLAQLTHMNTKQNSGYKRSIQLNVIRKDTKRPPSPSSRLQNSKMAYTPFDSSMLKNAHKGMGRRTRRRRVHWDPILATIALAQYSPKKEVLPLKSSFSTTTSTSSASTSSSYQSSNSPIIIQRFLFRS